MAQRNEKLSLETATECQIAVHCSDGRLKRVAGLCCGDLGMHRTQKPSHAPYISMLKLRAYPVRRWLICMIQKMKARVQVPVKLWCGKKNSKWPFLLLYYTERASESNDPTDTKYVTLEAFLTNSDKNKDCMGKYTQLSTTQ